MIDNIAYAIKIIVLIIGIWTFYKGNISGLFLLSIPFIMTGAEMVTNNELPWQYLILNGTETSLYKAFFGGVIFLALPFVLYAFCGKQMGELIDSIDGTKSNLDNR